MAASILTDKLTKHYAGSLATALDSLNLQVQPGQVYGFLGANGAGKTTTIRLLMNFLQPTGGSASIMGLDVAQKSVEVKKHVGYLAGDVALYQKATGRELLDYLASFQKNSDTGYRRLLEKRFQAEVNKPIATLSKGNRQKIGIIQATMHRPDVLILDEPTSGLDPLMQEVFYETVHESRSRGAAVLMSSHNLTEAQRVCDRIGIIKHGKLIREQSLGGDVALSKPVFRISLINTTSIGKLKNTPQLKFINQEGGNVVLVQPTGTIAAALKALSQFEIRKFTTEELSLEDEFLEFYGDSA